MMMMMMMMIDEWRYSIINNGCLDSSCRSFYELKGTASKLVHGKQW